MTNENLPYYKQIRAKFETNASAVEREFVNQVMSVNDVLGDAVKEMIVLGLDVEGVKAKFRMIMETADR